MADLIEVTLSSPTKVDLRVLMAGVQSVSAEELQHLREAGVVVTAEPVAEGNVVAANAGTVFDQAAFDAAVAAQAQLLAGQAFDGALAKMATELEEIVALAAAESQKLTMEKDAALGQATDAVAKAADLSEELTAVTAELDALKAAQTASQNTTVAKTTAKKGAATS